MRIVQRDDENRIQRCWFQCKIVEIRAKESWKISAKICVMKKWMNLNTGAETLAYLLLSFYISFLDFLLRFCQKIAQRAHTMTCVYYSPKFRKFRHEISWPWQLNTGQNMKKHFQEVMGTASFLVTYSNKEHLDSSKISSTLLKTKTKNPIPYAAGISSQFTYFCSCWCKTS